MQYLVHRASPPRLTLGLTLLELLATLTIAATLAVIASPAFERIGRQLAVLAGTHDVMSALHATRSASIMRGTPGVFCLTNAAGACLPSSARRGASFKSWLNTRGDSPALPDAGEPVIAQGQLPRDIDLRGSRASITFWPVSRAGTTNTILVCDARGVAEPDQVVVSQSGRPRLARGESVACW
jgi:type IV fimbrial biogenesis protein FimT